MRDPENIRAVEEILNPPSPPSPWRGAGGEAVEAMGFICWEGSSRNVADIPSYMPSCTRVGVFVNPTLQHVTERATSLGLNMLQLHGKETPSFCQQAARETGLPIIKAFSIETEQDLAATAQYEGIARLFLFDTKCKTVGGSGQQFDWDILRHYQGQTPFLLSGGIGPGDEQRLLQWHHPMWAGIDLNSRFELSPALKDVDKLREFLKDLSPSPSTKERGDDY